jgi:hypothetical protein
MRSPRQNERRSIVRKVTGKRARTAKRVLPPVRKGRRRAGALHSVDDLLSTGQKRALRQDLEQLAKVRREAEETSSNLRFS